MLKEPTEARQEHRPLRSWMMLPPVAIAFLLQAVAVSSAALSGFKSPASLGIVWLLLSVARDGKKWKGFYFVHKLQR